MMRLALTTSLLPVLLLATAAFSSEPASVACPRPETGRQAAEVLVKYRPGAKVKALAGERRVFPGLGVKKYAVPAGRTARAWARSLRRQPEVEWAEPNAWRYALAAEVVPNDPYYRPERNQRQYQQWYLPKINANFAWSLSKGSNALIVAVIDSGADLQHPDLKDRLLRGVSIVHQTDYTPPADGMDDNGHGTHVAGIIGAATDNNLGISGGSWQGRILPVKVLNHKGEGLDADIAEGILWAVANGAKIINLSLGGTAEDNTAPQVLQEAVDYAYSQGCLLIAAAGNSGDDQPHYPAALNHVLAVAGLDPWDRRAAYSTYGSFIDLSAPGGADDLQQHQETGIISTYWNENSRFTNFTGGPEAGEYAITAGTSAAAAVVSSAALVLWSLEPSYSPNQVEDVLKASARDIGAPGADTETGAGRVDLLAALGNPPVERPEFTLYNYPNPFHPEQDGATRIVFLLEQPREVQIRIYDSARDLVWSRRLGAAETVSGKNILAWNGRNDRGQAVANGVYFYHLTATNGSASRVKTLAVLR
ncbi:S8 family serine peptidase [candidate division FCPU426 bacterium]|nr:S8 family serine peptidase [candidate division FCPU426 bacterium]